MKKEGVPFTMVANAVLNNKNISWKAKGIFSYLYSKPDDWQFSAMRTQLAATDGYKSLISGIEELENAGYLKRQKNSDGTTDYFISFMPSVQNGNEAFRQVGETDTITNTDIYTKKDKKQKGAKAPKNYKTFLNQRRVSSGREPMEVQVASPKVRAALRRAWIIDEFHRRAIEAGLDYLSEEDDTANRKFFGLAKAMEKRYPERSRQQEYLDWWFENGEWANFHPSNFFSVSEWMKFENPKKQKGGVGIV